MNVERQLWLTVSGHINAEPGYAQSTAVINPVSELLLDLCGAGAEALPALPAPWLPCRSLCPPSSPQRSKQICPDESGRSATAA